MKRRQLTSGETDLWRRVVHDVAPLRSVHKTALLRNAPGGGGLLRRAEPVRAGDKPNATQNRSRAEDPFKAGDPKIDRHVRRGRIGVDATLDLHGYHQAAARGALYDFLRRAQAQGARCVLVITGKGALHAGSGRGILRARFREWLCEDALRRHIVRASPAHPRHGGGGAFYVFLKRPGPARR